MNDQRNTLELLAGYAAGHRDRRNILTHLVGVPMIVFGIAVMLARIRFSVTGLEVNGAWVAFCAAGAWYLSRRGALHLGLAVTAVTALLTALGQEASQGAAAPWLTWSVGAFAVGGAVQFLGHYYEGRGPAFVGDPLGLLVGPMFVTAEGLFMLGWNKPLLAEIERRAGPTHLRDLAHPA